MGSTLRSPGGASPSVCRQSVNTLKASPICLLCKQQSVQKARTFWTDCGDIVLNSRRSIVRTGALHSAAALTRTGSISASPFFLSNMRKHTHVGLGGMTFAVILSAQGADEVTCVSHSDVAPRCSISSVSSIGLSTVCGRGKPLPYGRMFSPSGTWPRRSSRRGGRCSARAGCCSRGCRRP